jgi:hypothetical protein
VTEPTKNPKLAAAGRAGMRARWGPPRVARLDGLPGPVADAVLALVEAQRLAAAPTQVRTLSTDPEESR